ncbi:MAG: hypothetical protein HGA86_01095 [Anaerolineaceae bacterium]|nr:hypothetical protein [Anaerolineaceae bacterium]
MRVVSRLIMIAAAMMLIIFAVAACVHPTRHPVDVLEPGTYEVDPLFNQLLSSLGGKEILGSAISLRFSYNQVECQYLQNALLCYDPQKPDRDRFSVYPLGKTFQVNEDLALDADVAAGTVVDRNLIFEEFIPVFEKLAGDIYVGKPLTRMHVNYEQRRVEQYFENLGFYRRFEDPVGDVHLLSYGAYACADRCPFASPEGSAIIKNNVAALDQPFSELLASTNNLDTFGQPLTPAQIITNNNLQVYESVVVVSPVDDPKAARLLELPILLGATTMRPGPQTANEQSGVKFYPVDGVLGYHVPLDFDQFIRTHGGYELSGAPIAEVIQYQPHIFRQCFNYYCLDYYSQNPEGARVRMAQLGREYLLSESLRAGEIQPTEQASSTQTAETMQPTVTAETQEPTATVETQEPTQPVKPTQILSDRKLVMQVNESYPQIPASSEQVINLLVLYEDDGSPAANIGATLLVTLSDGSDYSAQFPPTGPDGKAVIQIPAMPGLENGTILTYKVCLDHPGADNQCISEGYLIWNLK